MRGQEKAAVRPPPLSAAEEGVVVGVEQAVHVGVAGEDEGDPEDRPAQDVAEAVA